MPTHPITNEIYKRYCDSLAKKLREEYPGPRGMRLAEIKELHDKHFQGEFGPYKEFFKGKNKKPSKLFKGEEGKKAGLTITGENGSERINAAQDLPIEPHVLPQQSDYTGSDQLDYIRQMVAGDRTIELNQHFDRSDEILDTLNSVSRQLENLTGLVSRSDHFNEDAVPADEQPNSNIGVGVSYGDEGGGGEGGVFINGVWRTTPSLSSASIVTLRAFVENQKVSVSDHNTEVAENLSLHDLLQGERVDVNAIAHEMQKRAAEFNRNESNFPTHIRCSFRNFLLSAVNGSHIQLLSHFKTLAKALNITTTGLGIAVFGWWVIKPKGESNSEDPNGVNDPAIRSAIAETVRELTKKDRIEGNFCRDSSNRRYTDRVGALLDEEIIRDLSDAGVRRNTYRTEGEQTDSSATPDILLNEEITIQGRRVRWIECKNKLLIPGLSSGREVTSYDKQIKKYVENFGPGAVLWKKGFCEDIMERHAQVFHFSK